MPEKRPGFEKNATEAPTINAPCFAAATVCRGFAPATLTNTVAAPRFAIDALDHLLANQTSLSQAATPQGSPTKRKAPSGSATDRDNDPAAEVLAIVREEAAIDLAELSFAPPGKVETVMYVVPEAPGRSGRDPHGRGACPVFPAGYRPGSACTPAPSTTGDRARLSGARLPRP